MRREDEVFVSDKIEAQRKRSSHQRCDRRPVHSESRWRLNVSGDIPGAAYINTRSEKADSQELSAFQHLALARHPRKSPTAVQDITVDQRAKESDSLEQCVERSGASGSGGKDKCIEYGEIDCGVNRADNCKSNDLFDGLLSWMRNRRIIVTSGRLVSVARIAPNDRGQRRSEHGFHHKGTAQRSRNQNLFTTEARSTRRRPKMGGNSPLPLWPSCSTQGFFVFSVPPW